MKIIEGGLIGRKTDHTASAYDHWKGLKDRGVVIIVREPSRLFYLHDLMYWSRLYRESEKNQGKETHS